MIGRASEAGGQIEIYSERGSLITKVSRGDGLIGWTHNLVTVRRGHYIIDYDLHGAVRVVKHAPLGCAGIDPDLDLALAA